MNSKIIKSVGDTLHSIGFPESEVKRYKSDIMNYSILIILLFVWKSALGQNTITGHLPYHAGTTIYLTGFKGLSSYRLDSTLVSENGVFSLEYPKKYIGMGILDAGTQQSHVIVLEQGGVSLTGTSLSEKNSLRILKGLENKRFIRYAKEHQSRERMLSGWIQMRNIYAHDSLYSQQTATRSQIDYEIIRIRTEDSLYIFRLPEESYCKWYLPYRSLVSSVQTVAMYRKDEIPITLQEFREIDFADPRWQTSGLMKDAIESHVWLIENSAGPLDSVYATINASTDIMVEKLKDDQEVMNTVTRHLFKVLEQRSLFTSAEYLALKMLNDESCILDTDLSNMMESYRIMKKGNTASDIVFTGDVLSPGLIVHTLPKSLFELKSKYKVVIFGASWCVHCSVALQEISKYYSKWKQQGVEVVFISLDDDEQTFMNFAQEFPFNSICDYKKWESKAVKDYHIYATPTIYLLDNKHEIVLNPRSAQQLNAWIDWYLVKGNE